MKYFIKDIFDKKINLSILARRCCFWKTQSVFEGRNSKKTDKSDKSQNYINYMNYNLHFYILFPN